MIKIPLANTIRSVDKNSSVHFFYSNPNRRQVLRIKKDSYIARKTPKLNFNSIKIESKRFIEDVKVLKAFVKRSNTEV